MVLILAALIVFINSYPNVPEIAEETNDYRQLVKVRSGSNKTEQDKIVIKLPPAPDLPNTISLVSPEEINEIVNKPPKPTPKPTSPDHVNETPIETIPAQKEPPLEIKLLTGILNVAPLLLIAALGGFGIYLLFKYKKHFTLRSMFGMAIGLVAVCTIIFFGIIAFNFIEFLYDFSWDSELIGWSILPLAILFGGWISYSIISRRTTVFRRNMGLVFVGALMGAFLAAFLPFWFIFILLIGITLFDIYSVKFGPIKKIMELENETKGKRVEKKLIYRKVEKTSNEKILELKASDSMDLKYSKPTKVVNTSNVPKATKDLKDSIDTEDTKSAKAEKKVDTSYPLEQKTLLKDEAESSEKLPVQDRLPIQSDNTNEPSQPISTVKPARAMLHKKPKKTIRRKTQNEDFDLMLMFDNPNWSLGLGDFVIYSMFTSIVLTYTMIYLPYYIFYSPALGLLLPWVIFIICTVALLMGFFITLKLLEKREYLPGLPISIGLGLLVFVICILVLQIINYLLYSEFAIII
jgi:hypothetical protein